MYDLLIRALKSIILILLNKKRRNRMSTVNKELNELTLDDVNRISEEYLMGWQDLSKKYSFRIKEFNHKREFFGLEPLDKSMSDNYRIQYIQSHFLQDEIVKQISEYMKSNTMADAKWFGIEILNCRFGREYCKLFKQLIGNKLYRELSEQHRVQKLSDTQIKLYGEIGLGSIITKNKANATVSSKKWEFLQKAVRELNEHHCILTSYANSSIFEVFVYKALIDKFGKDDVLIDYGIHPYDKRYPYVCDFYIKSLDIFIELNIHFTHGGHWYDETNSADVLRKKHLMESDKKRNKKFLDTWCKRDIEKRECAKKSNIKLLSFWDGTTHHQGNTLVPNLSDFSKWMYEYDCDYDKFIKDYPENTY